VIRGLGGRVKRLRELYGWSIAELARRTGLGVAKLRLLEETGGNSYPRGRWYSGDVDRLAAGLNVSRLILRGEAPSTALGFNPATETEQQKVIRTLLAENEKLRKKRGTAEGELLKWGTDQRLEVRYVRHLQRESGYQVVDDGEYVLGEGSTMGEALRAARAASTLARREP
jgi:transcriptional regulator with XRE-family HTH domain